ncbi:DUF87 domain-containing protein [uncultured Roseobacter sp.]|uniref:type IV secretory system conjugative DNA transfer family protein n=1 Tax=uncultured Roseobacter sp. TaxID=114847 RepID=UPI00261F7C0A|nr:DUF87 domain-containing protein [uncultured Roseobacter sp.]
MPNEFIELGVREVWNEQHPIRLSVFDRARHLYLLGQTGTGKSTLIENLVRQDIEAGAGVTLIDPHGDLAETIYDVVPSHRTDDVVIIDPTDVEHVPGLNPFYRVPLDERPTIASNLVETFRHVWSDSWGPRLQHILLNATRLLLDSPDSLRPTIISIARILVEKDYRANALRHCTDPTVERFFTKEFDVWNQRFLTEALAPVQNKLGAVLANPNVRNILGQWRPSVTLADIIERERILVVRVPKGILGETQASLVGSMVVSGLMQAAMAQSGQRTPHSLYIDEFQNFTTDSFSTILAEARKFKLRLTIGHQFTGQLPLEIKDAVFGNVGTIVSFRVGADDADRMARECRDFATSRFTDLKLGQIIVKTMGRGGTPVSYMGSTLPPRRGVGTSRRVVDKSRRAHGRPRQVVEQRIGQWLRG